MKKLIALSIVFPLTFGFVLGSAPTAFAKTLQVGVDSSTSVEVDGVIDVRGEAEVNANGSVESDSDTEGVGITITRESAAEESIDATIANSGAVESSSDLSLFASAIVKTDENVENVELSEDAVSMRYKQRARLFGLIPVFVYAKATVESDGSVSVSYPWYGFLLSQEERVSLESGLNAAVHADAQIGAAIDANSKLSSKTQALILQKVHTAMEQNLEASLAAPAEANAKLE